MAHVNRAAPGRPVVQSCRFLPIDEDGSLPLADYINETGLAGARCNAVLTHHNYSLILTDTPQVEDEELAEAMRWKIQDLIDFPIDEAVIDVFRLPEDAMLGNAKMAYVAVSRRFLIQEVITLLNSSRVELESIDISELALRNLSLLIDDGSELEDDPHGLAMVQLSPGSGNLNIIKNRQLYLSRKFDIDWDGGLLTPLPINSLALELQRSLDYYEGQMEQVPPSVIYLCGEGVSQDKLAGYPQQSSLSSELRVLPLTELVELPEGADELMLTNCVGAIGGALREMVAS